jgi:hypothetical protein
VDTWVIIVIVLVAILALLVIGGVVANARRTRSPEAIARFAEDLEKVNRQLAAAHAQDKGWAPDTLDAAARAAVQEARPDATLEDVTLVEVVDRPGTEEDKAVFRVVTDQGDALLTLGRRDGGWVSEGLA